MSTYVGGLSEVQAATKDVQTLIEKVRIDLEGKVNKSFQEYTAVSFKTQLVAGTNYFVKVKVSATDYIHIRVFNPLPHSNSEPELTSFQLNKSINDDIEYF